MKTSFFATKLQEFIKLNDVSRDLVIDIFNHSGFDELSKCDLTTLSRWVSGKTEPSLYKQYLVCIALDIDLFDYVKNIDPLTCVESKKDREAIESYSRYLNNSNAIIGYFPRTEQVEIHYGFLDKKNHRKILDPYFSNFSGFMSLRDKIDESQIDKPFHTYLFKEGGNVCGHISFTDDCVEHLKVFGVYTESLQYSIGITPSYFIDSKVYWMLASSLLYFYLSTGNYKKNLYATMSTRDRNSWEFYKQAADGETLAFLTPTSQSNSMDKGLFYIKLNILRMLSRPTVLKKFQEFMLAYPHDSNLPINE